MSESSRNFWELLHERMRSSLLCVGLDSDFNSLPPHFRSHTAGAGWDVDATVLLFNQRIIEAVAPFACAFKFNLAFYLKYGADGIAALQHSIAAAHQIAPDVPVILDAKWQDVGNTCAVLAETAFDHFKADAVTLGILSGLKGLEPFLKRRDKGAFFWVYPSGEDVSPLFTAPVSAGISGSRPFFLHATRRIHAEMNEGRNCGLVVGANNPKVLRQVRAIVGNDMPILAPGVGAQGADVGQAQESGADEDGAGIFFSASRSIIFASSERDFVEAAGKAAERHWRHIEQYRKRPT
jgi:orotidine-5'-phosphate decarboxylase